ncbi:MAG: TonB-dependent receptor [Desulfobacteraceae bacterium]|nr:TonB-dependent receptor [Desulfobacteraceae bacterium]MBC2720277.1 TonB-dependent receptor [Desulfobacteraceae bacterium]
MDLLRLFYKEKDLVVSPTRYPKPISQAAENITIITAKNIEDMNAHTVAEILNRVSGILISSNQDFGAISLFHIQGSGSRHVLVMLDGVPWNYLNGGSAETNSIPVGIIERIEIIKGPALSAWSSSLGGVINIITKSAGKSEKPDGSISASYGKSDSLDYRVQVASKAGSVGYYLFAGYQKSDGLRDSRNFDNTSLYSKFKIPFSKSVNIGITMGCSAPQIELGDFPSVDITQTGDTRTFFGTASLDALLNKDLSLNFSVYNFKQKSVITNNSLGLGSTGFAGELFLNTSFIEETTGGSGKLVWIHGIHTAVLGVDFSRGKLDQTITAGSYLQSLPPPYNEPPTTKTHPDINKWAIFVNDTIAIDRWTITSGIRYDHNDITSSFVSPSVGVTYKLGKDSILKASVARGFTIPPLSWTSGGALYLDPNPSLDPEEVWSYQAGAETGAINYLWLKAAVFHHELKNALTLAYGEPPANDIYINEGKVRRNGIEIEAATVAIYNVSMSAGFVYIDINPTNERGLGCNYACDIGIRYDDKKSFMVELFGNYMWLDLDESSMAEYDDFIWDFNLNKRIRSKEKTATELFLTAHNIFNKSRYTYGDSKNPGTWIEAGIRFNF